jgi:hypothetical protein
VRINKHNLHLGIRMVLIPLLRSGFLVIIAKTIESCWYLILCEKKPILCMCICWFYYISLNIPIIHRYGTYYMEAMFLT